MILAKLDKPRMISSKLNVDNRKESKKNNRVGERAL